MRQRSRMGFSLLEILAVIAVIGVLSAVGLGLMDAARTQAETARTRGELAALSAALERYRATFGDYPYASGDAVADNRRLYQSLLGLLQPDGTPVQERSMAVACMDPANFTVGERHAHGFAVQTVLRSVEGTNGLVLLDADADDHVMLDPFGVPFVYLYKSAADDARWQRPGYLLASLGPSGSEQSFAGEGQALLGLLPGGVLPFAYRESSVHADNLFAHE